jgi:tRNA (cmo5U34)-methyltransferase
LAFIGVDPASAMLDLARAVAGPAAGDRLTLIEGTVADAPAGPFDAATCVLVLGLLPDDGSKLDLLRGTYDRLRPGAPFVLVDQCFDRDTADFDTRLERYAAYARRSGVNDDVVTGAKANLRTATSGVPAWRNEQLLDEAGFKHVESFYVGMAWRGWIAYA